MLSLKNVSAGYGGVDVVRNVSFQVSGNLSIIGPNGCGKTTLLKAIGGILPSKGEIEILGTPISAMKRREISLNIAMLSQQVAIYFAYSVFDTVMMGRYLYIKNGLTSAPSKRDKEVVLESLCAVGLLDEKDRDITKLSGGQLQRVFLARALAQEPKVILLDEPTNHLDLKCQVEIIEHLKNWQAQGDRAVIGVLHDINLAMQLSNRLLIMKNGEIQADDNAENIIQSGLLNDTYDMDVRKYMRESLSRW